MALQKKVNVDPALGVPGSQAAFLGEVITVHNYLSDGTATAGQFCWNGTFTGTDWAAGTPVGNVATGNGTGGGALAGLVVRLQTGVLPDGVAGELKYERGELEPSIETLQKLANFFECSIDYLVGREDDFGNITIKAENAAPALTEQERKLLEHFRVFDVKMQQRVFALVEVLRQDYEEIKSKEYR